MEQQQKLLWTILSVAILILILLGAGMFFFLPADSTGIAKGGKTAAPTEWSKSSTPAPAIAKEEPKTQPAPAPAKTEIKKVEPVKTEVKKAEPVKTEIKKTEIAKTEVKKTEPAKTPVVAPKPAPAPVKTEVKKSEPVKTEVKKAEPAKTTTTAAATKGSYWIQVGSFGTMDTAEKIKGQLSAKGYKSTIQTISSNGKTFHRVKLGPYATKGDVDSLLPKIKAIDGMGGSFITTK